MNAKGRIISIKEARKLLGVRFSFMFDKEVEALIHDLDFIASMLIRKEVPDSKIHS